MRILGINAYSHDASVAIVEDGVPIFALEEERLNRRRKTTGFPKQCIALLREELGLDLSDFDRIVLPFIPLHVIGFALRLFLGSFPPAWRMLTPAASPNLHVGTALSFYRASWDVAYAFERKRPARVDFINHHLAHAHNAYGLSSFDDAALLVMDAFGGDCSTSTWRAQGDRINRLTGNRVIESLGILYAMVTTHLGFQSILDEGKVMALASHGSDDLYEKFRALVKLEPHGTYRIDFTPFDYPRYGEMRPVAKGFIRTFGPGRKPGAPLTQEHKDLARALQRTIEDTAVHVARGLQVATGTRHLCLGGGVAMNCLANGRIATECGFEEVFVSPMPTDAGVALGAALSACGVRTAGRMASPFLGPEYADGELERILEQYGVPYRRVADPAAVAARELAHGRVVAWFQGRSEAGPRALGNRSILGDPRDPTLRSRLNQRIKKREAYRPYAPSVLAEHASEFFLTSPPSPHMSFAAQVRPDKRHLIPAVLAVDGTARIQTVTSEFNPSFHRLIQLFYHATSIPMVLNTSFNVREPTICRPEDGVRTFLASEIDTLLMGPFVAGHRASHSKTLGG